MENDTMKPQWLLVEFHMYDILQLEYQVVVKHINPVSTPPHKLKTLKPLEVLFLFSVI